MGVLVPVLLTIVLLVLIKRIRTPRISLVNEEQSASGFQYVNISCSVYVPYYNKSSLFFQCNESSNHREVVGDGNGSDITDILTIAVQSHDSLINCTCVLKYMHNGQIYNETETNLFSLRANQTPSLQLFPQMDTLYRPFPVTEIVGVLVTVIVTTVVLMLVKHFRDITSHEQEHCQRTSPAASETEPRQITDSVTELSVTENFNHTFDQCDVSLDACAKESTLALKERSQMQALREISSDVRDIPVSEDGQMPVTKDDDKPMDDDDHIEVAKGFDIPVAKDDDIPVSEDGLIPVSEDGLIYVAEDVLIPVAEDGLIPVAEDDDIPVAENVLMPVAEAGDIPVGKDGLIYAELDFVNTHLGDSHLQPMPHRTEYTVIDFKNIKMKQNESK